MGRSITSIVIHCSATPNGRPTTSEDIDAWHKARGFQRDKNFLDRCEPKLRHIGYHYLIYTTGRVRAGRDEREAGAHVQGHNAHSIGICMVGTDRYTAEQWNALSVLLGRVQARYPDAAVKGHRDLSPDRDGDGTVEPHEWLKTCPGFDVSSWLAAGMKPQAAHVLETSP